MFQQAEIGSICYTSITLCWGMPCYCRLQNGICCKEAQSGADGRRKQSPRLNRHKDVYRNEDGDMNGGVNKSVGEGSPC